MNESINLISDKRKGALRRDRSIKIAQRFAIFFLIFVLAVSAALFFAIQNTSLTALSQKEKNDTQTLSFLQQKIVSLFYLDERLKSIDSLIKGRLALEVAIGKIIAGLPNSASIDTFSLDKQNLSITISATSLTPLNDFLNFFIDEATKKELITKITVSSITVDPKSERYVMSIVAQPL